MGKKMQQTTYVIAIKLLGVKCLTIVLLNIINCILKR